MKKILIILFCLLPLTLLGQKYNVRFAETSEGIAALHGNDSLNYHIPYANRVNISSLAVMKGECLF